MKTSATTTTIPAKAPAPAQPAPTEAEQKAARKARLLQRKTEEELVRMYTNNERLMDQLHDDQQQILNALGERFPCQKQEEVITTPAGVAKRKATNAWRVDADRIGELEQHFTRAQLAEIFEEKHKHKVPDARMTDLVAYLGKKVKDYVVTLTSYSITRTAQNRYKTDDTFRQRLGDVVTVQPDVKITVTRVGEP